MSAGLRRFVVCAAVMTLARPSAAEDTDDLRSLLSQNVTTTASTSAQTASTAPALSVTITAEDLRTHGIRSLDEAINFLALGVVTSNPLRTPDIGARGVLLPRDNGKHFLLLVNGHALNDPLYGAARFDQGSGVPIEIIDRIEVIVGPGSVLYGSNAMMGVINVITKEAAVYRGGHLVAEHEPARSVQAGAGTGFTVESSEVTAHAGYFNRFGPDLDFELQPFSLFAPTGAPLNYGPRARTAGRWGGRVSQAYFSEAGSGLLRMRSGDFDIMLLGSTYRRGIPYAAPGTNVDFDDAESSELDRAIRFDVKHQATPSPLMQLTSRVYGDSFDYQRRVNRDGEIGCFQSDVGTCQYYEAGLARWVGTELRLAMNWNEDFSLVTQLGVDARMRWVSAKEDAIDVATGQPFERSAGLIDDSGGLLSPYIEQVWSPTGWLDLNAGARLDADERFDPIVSPRAAVAVSPFQNTTFKVIYAQAFRAPSWSETNPTSRRQIRSPDIEPEIVRSAEASVEQRFAAQRLLFGVFRTWWDNLIEPHVLSTFELGEAQRRGELPITTNEAAVTQYRNVSDVNNYGWNGGWDGSLVDGRLTYGLNATAAFTRRQTGATSQELPVAPQLFGNAHAAYDLGGPLPTLAIAAHYVGQRPADRAFDGGFAPTPYADPALELRGTLTGPVPVVDGLSYRATVSYATASEGPYVVGPAQQAGATTSPFLNPVDTFTIFYGLSYDFWTGSNASQDELP